MNKKIMMTLAALSIAAVIGLIFSQNISVSADPDLTKQDVRDKVTAQYPGKITEIDLDSDGKNPVYEVEIEIEGKEYELEIDGNTGEVLRLDEKLVATTNVEKTDDKQETTEKAVAEKREKEAIQIKEKAEEKAKAEEAAKKAEKAKAEETAKKAEKTTVTAPKNTEKEASQAKAEPKQTEKPKAQPKEQEKVETKPVEKKPEPKKETKKETKKSVISRDQAINIALKQFSGRVEDVELDDDDGRLIYEIELENKRGDEAEIEIDAYTGAVLVVDIDLEDDDD